MATRLRLAVDTGDVARLRDLAANGANLAGHVPSLVLCAVLSGQPGIITCLRELNAPTAPEKGHRHWACQLKRVDIASVKELRAMILAAGGTDRGLIEKSELRARARECLAAKLEPEEKAEEVD